MIVKKLNKNKKENIMKILNLCFLFIILNLQCFGNGKEYTAISSSNKIEFIPQITSQEFKDKYGSNSLCHLIRCPTLPKNIPVTLFSKNLKGDIASWDAFTNSDCIICYEHYGETPFKLVILENNVAVGEPFEITVSPRDICGKVEVAKGVNIPYPLEVHDKNGHYIIGKLTSHFLGDYFTFDAGGFLPYEKVTIISASLHERIKTEAEADDEGKIHLFSMFGVIGETDGIFKLTMKGKTTENLSISHFWGPLAYATYDQYLEMKHYLDKYREPFYFNDRELIKIY